MFAHDGLGVEGNAQTSDRDHVDVVGAVAHRHGLGQGHPNFGGETLQGPGLAGAIDNGAREASREFALDDLEAIGLEVVHVQLREQWRQDFDETTRHDRGHVAETLEGAHQRARARCET